MGRGVPGGLIWAIVLTIGSLAMVFIRAFGANGDGWHDIREFAPFYLGAIVLAFPFIALFTLYADARDRRLTRDHPDALVFGAEMTPALKDLLKSTPESAASPALAGRAPSWFTVVADADGVTFWLGPGWNPVKFWGVDWEAVWGLRPSRLQLQFKNMNGFVMDTHTGAAVGALEIAPRPTRFFASSLGTDEISVLTERLTEVWHASRKASPIS